MSSDTAIEILVTGGSGFLGRAIVHALAERHPDWRITVLDLQPPPPDIRAKIVRFISVDVTSEDAVKTAFGSYTPNIVVHSAGVVPARAFRYSTNRQQWEKVKAVNYHGTMHVFNAAVAAGCRQFVYTSSCTVVVDDLDHDYFYMNEDTPIGLATLHYGKSKGMAEQFVLSPTHRAQGVAACALRPATIIGPGDTAVLGVIHDLIAKGETYFIVGDGHNLYDFMYIDNAVHAHLLAIDNIMTTQTAAGHAFFISNQEPVFFWDFLAFIWAEFGHVPKFRVHIPMAIAWIAGLVLEYITWFTGAASTLDRGSVKDGVRTRYADNRKAIEILGYRPKVGMTEGVRRSCDAYKTILANRAGSKPSSFQKT